MGQNWIQVNDARMNNEVADLVEQMNLFIVYVDHDGDDEGETLGGSTCAPGGRRLTFDADPELYPWAARYAPRTCGCLAGTCSCRRSIVLQQALHLLAWDFKHGATNPRKKGEVIHHRNADKHDARWKNLGKGSRAAHARAHLARRQKFSHRERDVLRGFFWPRPPSRVVTRHEMIGTVAPTPPSRPRPLSTVQRIQAMETRLAPRWEALSAELAHLNTGMPIPRRAPRAAWQTGNTRKIGLRMPQLELSPGAAVYFLLLVRHGFDKALAASDAGEPFELLDLLWKRPAFSQALSNWRDVGRLPLAK